MATIALSSSGKATIEAARKRKGWNASESAWYELANTSQATLKRFRARKKIDHGSFVALCEAVGVTDWEAVADLDEPTPAPENLPSPQPVAPPSTDTPTNLSRYRRTVPKFVGRDVEMQGVSDLMAAHGAVYLMGMGGLGKTELAWQWAHREYAAGNFPGGVVWLDMAAGNPGEQLALFYQTEFDVTIPDTLTEVGERVAYCWQHWPRPGAVLVVLDDLARGRDGARLAMFRPGGLFWVLWTTREEWSGVERYPLDQLSDEAARELLASYIDPVRLDAESEAVAGVLRWFEGLPLGLELAGRYLALDGFLTIGDYLKELHLTHESLAEKPEEMRYEHNGIEAALALSWGRLKSDEARRLALSLSLFGAAPIPLSEEWQQNWRKPLKQLVNLSLLERKTKDQVKLHPIVRQFMQERLIVELPTEANGLKRAVAGIIVRAGKQLPQTLTMAQAKEFAPWIPHLEEVAANLLAWVVDEDLVDVFGFIALYHKEQGSYDMAEPWYIKCVKAAQVKFGNFHKDTACAINNLAELYRVQGRYKVAEKRYRQALSIDEKVLSHNDPQLCSHLNNLGLLYWERGSLTGEFKKHKDAEKILLRFERIARNNLSCNSPDLAIYINKLANVYSSQKRYNEAEEKYSEAIEIEEKRKDINPEQSKQLSVYLNGLATLFFKQGEHERSKELYQRVLCILKNTVHSTHPDFIFPLYNLGMLYQKQGNNLNSDRLDELHAQRIAALAQLGKIRQKSLLEMMQEFEIPDHYYQVNYPTLPRREDGAS
ncbi:tetratricopeptide repeat protein [Spirulina subsalsa]|uniref:tetratricopeptide repeat protein n=1 Tax=Spirulina subsalsa TaxID=54311 RepID=UPI0003064A8E|nr:tetratricopeptide repeat protein [Spirulina subsalsa]